PEKKKPPAELQQTQEPPRANEMVQRRIRLRELQEKTLRKLEEQLREDRRRKTSSGTLHVVNKSRLGEGENQEPSQTEVETKKTKQWTLMKGISHEDPIRNFVGQQQEEEQKGEKMESVKCENEGMPGNLGGQLEEDSGQLTEMQQQHDNHEEDPSETKMTNEDDIARSQLQKQNQELEPKLVEPQKDEEERVPGPSERPASEKEKATQEAPSRGLPEFPSPREKDEEGKRLERWENVETESESDSSQERQDERSVPSLEVHEQNAVQEEATGHEVVPSNEEDAGHLQDEEPNEELKPPTTETKNEQEQVQEPSLSHASEKATTQEAPSRELGEDPQENENCFGSGDGVGTGRSLGSRKELPNEHRVLIHDFREKKTVPDEFMASTTKPVREESSDHHPAEKQNEELELQSTMVCARIPKILKWQTYVGSSIWEQSGRYSVLPLGFHYPPYAYLSAPVFVVGVRNPLAVASPASRRTSIYTD
ncbi:unnamed protein product, partial [Darwinula stevensoni]